MATFDRLTGNLAPQSILNQHYLIVRLAGRGGMSAIYQALDMRMNQRRVAIKEMSQQDLGEREHAEAMARFQQEAHLLGALRHPNMPHIYDAFETGGRSFLVMDFIEGKTLLQLLQEAGQPLPVDQVLSYANQLCEVLSYLHQQRPPIVFRDLKPTNVMVTPQGHVYLIDFGIARFFKEGQPQDTFMLGSPGYAPPEQHGSGQTSPRSDLYALGATLHCCLSNRDPYHATERFAFPPVRQLNPNVPPELDQLIQRLLALDEHKRPASALEVRHMLASIQRQSASVPAVSPPSSAPTQYVGPAQPPVYQATQPALEQRDEAREKLFLHAVPQAATPPPTMPMTPGAGAPPYPLHTPTQHVGSAGTPQRLWTPGFALLFLLVLVVTLGGSILAFNIPDPYGSGNSAGLDHATEFALTFLALFISFTTLVRARNWLAALTFLLNAAGLIGLGLVFLDQTLHDIRSAIQPFVQFAPAQTASVLLYGSLAAGISLVCWLFSTRANWRQRLLLFSFGGAGVLCALFQAQYMDITIPKHLLLLGVLIIFIQGVLLAGQVARHQNV